MNKNTLGFARLALLIALTLVIQMIGFPQPITGPLINALLFFTAALLGPIAGMILGMITPVVALIRGQLPPVFAPMVPFIALGNASLVFVYAAVYINWLSWIKQKWAIFLPIVLASLVKYLVMLFSVRFIVPLFIGHRFPPQIEIAMAAPQLITALAGGIIFILMLRAVKRWIPVRPE